MVVARIIAALAMAYAISFMMSLVFTKEEQDRTESQESDTNSKIIIVSKKHLFLLGLIVLSLLMPNYLVTSGPYLYKVLVWFGFTVPVIAYAWKIIEKDRIKEWLRETWWFVKIIFPLLLAGVFIVGVIGKVLPEEWIEKWLGGNGIRQSFLATLLGAVTYFATMTEAPFVDTMIKLGMGKGPALALLLTGPGISLPNWLAVAKVFGVKKALVYIPAIIVLGTMAGFIYGLF
jgi:uncharacterized membrane protein YraQ (UPF0718 family)